MLYKEWDSQVLGMPVYELENVEEAPLSSYYTFYKSYYDLRKIHKLEQYGYKLCDISIQYLLDLSKSATYETYGIRYLDKLDIDRVLDITRNSFYLDRFHKDPNLTDEQADSMYRE